VIAITFFSAGIFNNIAIGCLSFVLIPIPDATPDNYFFHRSVLE